MKVAWRIFWDYGTWLWFVYFAVFGSSVVAAIAAITMAVTGILTTLLWRNMQIQRDYWKRLAEEGDQG